MTRPRQSTLVATALVLVAILLGVTAVLLGLSAEPRGGKIVVTVRLWDEPIAAAYRQSFAAFTRSHPDIEVRTNLVAYSTYFETLRTDVAGGSADDIFWLSNAYFAAYADSGRLMKIQTDAADWEPAVVDQFTRSGVLWGVPQLTDAGIAVFYNADLLAAAGVDPTQVDNLRWSRGDDDTLRPMLARLTVDADGRTANTPGFDARRVRQWGYNAANDPQAIYLNYIGSAGGVFQRDGKFAFDNPGAIEAFRYLVGLINDDHVAPPASDTNDNGDFSRNQFLAGKMALFQSGTYSLAPVARDALFHWGVAMLPAGPAGRVSVTNGIAAAGNPRRARRTRPRRRCRTTIRRPAGRPRSPAARRAVTDQRAPQRRQEGRVDRVEQRTGYGRGAGGLGGRIRARARGQGLHKLDMKRRRLRAERLIGLAVRPKSRRDGHRHLIGARGQHRRRVGRGRGVGRPDRRTDACQIRGRCRDGLRRRDHKRYVTPPKRSWPNKPGQPGRDAQVFQRLMDRSALHRPTGSEIPGFPALLTDPWVFGSAR